MRQIINIDACTENLEMRLRRLRVTILRVASTLNLFLNKAWTGSVKSLSVKGSCKHSSLFCLGVYVKLVAS